MSAADLMFRAPVWRCAVHGETDCVVTFVMHGQGATYCLHCLLATLERLGVRPVKLVE